MNRHHRLIRQAYYNDVAISAASNQSITSPPPGRDAMGAESANPPMLAPRSPSFGSSPRVMVARYLARWQSVRSQRAPFQRVGAMTAESKQTG